MLKRTAIVQMETVLCRDFMYCCEVYCVFVYFCVLIWAVFLMLFLLLLISSPQFSWEWDIFKYFMLSVVGLRLTKTNPKIVDSDAICHKSYLLVLFQIIALVIIEN